MYSISKVKKSKFLNLFLVNFTVFSLFVGYFSSFSMITLAEEASSDDSQSQSSSSSQSSLEVDEQTSGSSSSSSSLESSSSSSNSTSSEDENDSKEEISSSQSSSVNSSQSSKSEKATKLTPEKKEQLKKDFKDKFSKKESNCEKINKNIAKISNDDIYNCLKKDNNRQLIVINLHEKNESNFTPKNLAESNIKLNKIQSNIQSFEKKVRDNKDFDLKNITSKGQYTSFLVASLNAEEFKKISSYSLVKSLNLNRKLSSNLDSSTNVIGSKVANNAPYSITGNGFSVAVIDSGVDYNHPMFAGKIQDEMCYAQNIPNEQMIDFDGDGTGDDIDGDGGVDYFGLKTGCSNGETQSTAAGSGLNCDVNEDQSCSHGTHVAGIAVGKHPTNPALSGVAPEGGLVAANAATFPYIYLSSGDGFAYDQVTYYFSDIKLSLDRIYNYSRFVSNIASVNMSLGGGYSGDYCDIYADPNDPADPINATKVGIESLKAVGIPVVIASGNEYAKYGVSYPACLAEAITVGATNDDDTIAEYSNIGNQIDLVAPGSDITSSVVGGGYESYYGTSMSTPHVAGSWLLMKQYCQTTTYCNGDNVDEVLTILKTTAVDVIDTRAWTESPATNRPLKRLSLVNNIQIGKVLKLNNTLISGSDTNTVDRSNVDNILTYTIQVSNPDTDYHIGTAINNEINDILPAGLVFVSYTATNGTFSNNTWTIPELKPNQVAELNLQVRVDQSAEGKTVLANTANINKFMLMDLDLENNQATSQEFAVNMRPTSNDYTVQFVESQAEAIFDINKDSIDLDGIISSITIVSGPQEGTVEIVDVKLIYQGIPTKVNTITYRVCDNENACRLYTITINPYIVPNQVTKTIDLIRTGGLFENIASLSQNNQNFAFTVLISSLILFAGLGYFFYPKLMIKKQ
jgi:uncharacterized repeat protein (TIGR01451 family)